MTLQAIVAKEIKQIWYKEEYCAEYQMSGQALLIEFKDGVIITPPDEDNPPALVNDTEGFKPFQENNQCRGQCILEVLASDQLPHYGLLLSNGKVLWPDRLSPDLVGWCIDHYTPELKVRYDFRGIING